MSQEGTERLVVRRHRTSIDRKWPSMLVGCWLAIGQKGTCLLLARGGEDSRSRKNSTWRSSSILQFCSAAGLSILAITVDQFRTDSYYKSCWSLCKISLRCIHIDNHVIKCIDLVISSF